MSKNFLQTIACVLLSITFNNSFSQQINSPLLCTKTTDEVGCLLNLAKSKAMAEKNIETRSEALSSLLKTHSNLRRSDYELLSHASNLLKNKKLAVENFLELEIAIASYLAQFQTEKSKEKIDKAVAVFIQAIKHSNNQEKIKLYTWACGLVDLNSTVWKLTLEFVTNTCLPEEIKKIQSTNQIEGLLTSVLVMHSSWVQSDYMEMQSAIEEFESSITRIETVGIKRKHKELNALTQNMKVLIYTLQSSMFSQSGMTSQASKAFSQAKEALTGFEKLTTSSETIEARVQVASLLNETLRFKEALEFLQPITERFDSPNKVKGISTETQVNYLCALAYATAQGGFRDAIEIRTYRLEKRNRQGDVLYEKYSALAAKDPSKDALSSATAVALIRAAEEGNILAMHNLALAYNFGMGKIPKNQNKALYWYTWSAVSGFAGAQNNLGDMFEKGEGTPTSIGSAIYWYTQAAMQGEPTAYLSLGELFFEGKGVPQSYVTAAIWLSLATRELPEGANFESAKIMRDKAFGILDEKSRNYVLSRVRSFVPLKQTENTLSDKPKTGIGL
jgi:TPR repeat protein